MRDELHGKDFKVEANLDAGETLNKKIRNAQLAHFNFILGKRLFLFFIRLSIIGHNVSFSNHDLTKQYFNIDSCNMIG